VSGKKIVDDKTKERMKEVLKDIQSGKFTKDWMKENEAGQKKLSSDEKRSCGSSHRAGWRKTKSPNALDF